MDLKELTILVGKNNAGKSTLIEALRIISVITNRFESLNFLPAPKWITGDINNGVSPSLDNLNISTQNIFHLYGDPPSTIEVEFTNKTKIVAYIGAEAQVFALVFDSEGNPILNKRAAKNVTIPVINILPQISPLQGDEKILRYETVRSNLLTRLSSRNFRNQLHYFPESYDRFKELAEKTWVGLELKPLESDSFSGDSLSLMIREGSFVSEIGWTGHGLQMWLQTMWFLVRSQEDSTVILDEPDVYMHADLQRRLIRLIKPMFSQTIIATHSVEIMAEVESEHILPVNNNKSKLQYANKNGVVQKIINEIGSVHNIEIVRLFSCGKILIVEGDKDDVKILGLLQNILFPNSHIPFDIIPKTFVEGWSGWQRVIGSNNVFQHTATEIKAYCIFDSDYHTDDEKKARYADAKSHKVNLHIWERKEIENYLINPNVIYRLINKTKRKGALTVDDVKAKIAHFAEDLKISTTDKFANEIQKQDRGKAISTVNKEAREIVENKWNNPSYIVSGKELIAKLSGWSQDAYGVSFSPFSIAREFSQNDICQEMKDIITQIENGENFVKPT